MTDKELKKLRRSDLLEMLIAQSKEVESLKKQLQEALEQLERRDIAISSAGSIAEAALGVNQIFEIAQKTADQYLENVQRVYSAMPIQPPVFEPLTSEPLVAMPIEATKEPEIVEETSAFIPPVQPAYVPPIQPTGSNPLWQPPVAPASQPLYTQVPQVNPVTPVAPVTSVVPNEPVTPAVAYERKTPAAKKKTVVKPVKKSRK